ncbi:MAG TPA: TetR/AcrR family transcriptional regulator [Ideonella sp.]|uniref:TetR/AcrR family transcriptional regulator n=1 Tax=Ideonella sp. TaxID=1929293 RepID=UPI002E2ED688|nr:TetR/AcrR family transcriptional regulator [Ideonella sp.]HEX5683096.1 TetR/AcrR family transcriptional regulator [Ideonella sp.]
MKTSKAQQDATRARIVRCAVDLIVRHGYDAVTMKDIAKAAAIGDATIYKYFATKERLILGYFDQVTEQAVRVAHETPDFASYDLQSKLQRLTDALLELLAPDRAFVGVAGDMLKKSPLLLLGDQLQAKLTLKEAVATFLDAAVQQGELPPSDFARPMAGMYADFCYGVMAFWMRDETPHAAETTRFVDQVLGVAVAMLKAGLPDRLVHLAGFVLRSQIARVMDVAVHARPRQDAEVPAAKKRRAPPQADTAGSTRKPRGTRGETTQRKP